MVEGARLEIVYTAKTVSRVQIPSSPPFLTYSFFEIQTPCGGVAEWLNAAVSKTVRRVFPVSRVQIPPPPPHLNAKRYSFFICACAHSSLLEQKSHQCFVL